MEGGGPCHGTISTMVNPALRPKQQQQQQPFYGPLSETTWVSRYQKKTFTHSHLSWSSTIPYQHPPPTMVDSILPVQFICLTVFFHNLSPSPLWSPLRLAFSISVSNRFLQPITVFFLQHMPIPMQLFRCSTKLMLSIPGLSLFTWNFMFCSDITLPIILISACWSVTLFSFVTGHVLLPHNILLCTQLLQNLNDISILVSNTQKQ